MLRVHQIKLSLDQAAAQHPAGTVGESLLRSLCAKRLRIPAETIQRAVLVKRSVDARDKGDVHFALTVDLALAGGKKAETAIAAKEKPNEVTLLGGDREASVELLLGGPLWRGSSGAQGADSPRPLVVGAGPAGLFCAYSLARRGANPILIERGQPVEGRANSVDALEREGLLDPESHVLFGEGGAGAFSDGKLTCGLNHPHIPTVLRTLVDAGAPEDILTAQRPHIGTDELRRVLKNLRRRLQEMGVDIRFGHRLDGLVLRSGRVVQAMVSAAQGAGPCQTEVLAASHVFLAIGHSARDTYAWLHEMGLPMEQKPFAVGLRIEHPQGDIDKAQYGRAAGHSALPPAEYKLNVATPDGRGVYTFCMCPGGQVIASMSEEGTINVNGMSLHARAGENANAALLVGVRPADFGDDHPLAGVRFQRDIERRAYALANPSISGAGGKQSLLAPCQRVEDFLQGRATTAYGAVRPSYRPGTWMGEMTPCLPPFVAENLRYALPRLGQRLKGFDHPDALLTGPETRSSSPVRLLRNSHRESALPGLYPIGEGAGYAGGIVSAAVDGLLAGMECDG